MTTEIIPATKNLPTRDLLFIIASDLDATGAQPFTPERGIHAASPCPARGPRLPSDPPKFAPAFGVRRAAALSLPHALRTAVSAIAKRSRTAPSRPPIES